MILKNIVTRLILNKDLSNSELNFLFKKIMYRFEVMRYSHRFLHELFEEQGILFNVLAFA